MARGGTDTNNPTLAWASQSGDDLASLADRIRAIRTAAQLGSRMTQNDLGGASHNEQR